MSEAVGCGWLGARVTIGCSVSRFGFTVGMGKRKALDGAQELISAVRLCA